MSRMKWIAVLAASLALGLSLGCESDDSDDDAGGGGGGGATAGSYAGTWTGHVGGRGMTMVMSQNGTTLSGTYTFSDPTFNGTFSGAVSSATPPATAHLVCGSGHDDWWFDFSFSSFNQLSGGFFKPENGGVGVDIDATK